MKLIFILVTLVTAMFSEALGQIQRNEMQEELLKLEKEFAHAVVKNDPEAIGRFLADDWVIIDPDGGIIDRPRFLGVIASGTLTHEMMESDDVSVRIYADSAVVTALTTTKGKFMGQEFHYAGASNGCVSKARWTMAVRIFPTHAIHQEVNQLSQVSRR
jgi:ketosteroid isomerase-like protein